MITGNSERKIEKYLPIDRCGDGFGFEIPKNGEEFIGIPYQWHSENSMAFIEYRVNGIVTKTVNALDVSEILFKKVDDQIPLKQKLKRKEGT